MKKIFGVSRNVFSLGWVSFFNDFSAEMVHSVMPVFLTTVLGAPVYIVGLIEGAADALGSVLKFFSGWVSDRIKRRRAPAIAGYILSVGVRPFLALVTGYWQVFGIRMVDRVGKGMRDAPRDALIVESSEKRELGKSFGFHRSMDTLGATFGPLAAIALLPFLHGSYRSLFLVAFVIGIFSLASFAFVYETRAAAAAPAAGPAMPAAPPGRIFEKRFLLVMIAIFIFGLGALPIDLVLLKAKGVKLLVPLMYFVFNISFVATAIPLGRFADRIGEKIIIAGGFFLAALVYLGLAKSTAHLSVVLLFILLGFSSAAIDGLMRVLASRFLTGGTLATGQGFLNMALGFSSLGAGLIGGLLWTNMGSAASFTYAAALSLAGMMLFVLVAARRQKT